MIINDTNKHLMVNFSKGPHCDKEFDTSGEEDPDDHHSVHYTCKKKSACGEFLFDLANSVCDFVFARPKN